MPLRLNEVCINPLIDAILLLGHLKQRKQSIPYRIFITSTIIEINMFSHERSYMIEEGTANEIVCHSGRFQSFPI